MIACKMLWGNTKKGLAEYKKLYNFAPFNSTMNFSGTSLSKVRPFVRQIAIIHVIALVFLSSCVERYYPNDLYLMAGQLVINAHITNIPGTQTVEISRSAHPEIPSFNPESGCFVLLLREDGESHEFTISDNPGFYTADLDSSFLRTGMLFQLQVITSDGNEYHSDFDEIRPVPAIDAVHYKIEEMMYTGEDEAVPGIRFYVDFTYDDESYEYIRWELTETYEFHNPDMEAYVYYNRWTLRDLVGEDNPRTCYITKALPAIHSLSTKELDFGSFSKAFDFVPNDQMEQKLLFKYSLLVRQYSVGAEGFHYWNEIGQNIQSQGALFDKQPPLLQSNICNIADESEKVLGFFTMSAMQEIRAFAEDIPGFENSINPYYCLPVDSGPGSNRPTTYPSYFARATYDGATVYARVNKHCVDCREYKGSTAIKPDFW
ncbi:MAG: DUF4249 domain-containing protein [Bacteroidota bacterium]|nr:DUF4249 domain-containing protein [Bacteroidota bacterium]